MQPRNVPSISASSSGGKRIAERFLVDLFLGPTSGLEKVDSGSIARFDEGRLPFSSVMVVAQGVNDLFLAVKAEGV